MFCEGAADVLLLAPLAYWGFMMWRSMLREGYNGSKEDSDSARALPTSGARVSLCRVQRFRALGVWGLELNRRAVWGLELKGLRYICTQRFVSAAHHTKP